MRFVYDIVHDSSKIGEHVVETQPEGDGVRVVHRRSIDVRALLVRVFSERHEAVEMWDGGLNLRSLEGHTVRNGERIDVAGRAESDAFLAVVGGSSRRLGRSVSTTDSYWLAEAVDHDTVIDVAQGAIMAASKRRGDSGDLVLTAGDQTATLWFAGPFLERAELLHDGHRILYRRTAAGTL